MGGRGRLRLFPPLFTNVAFFLRTVRRFWRDERGQDFVEYALLAAAIAAAGVLVLPSLGARLGVAFTSRETPVYNLWVPPDPAVP
jgi:Flp pilus assembly pilin Flp